MEWFYIQDNEKHGPVVQRELVSLVKEGAITRHTLVWKKGMDAWEKADYALDLFPPINLKEKKTRKRKISLSFIKSQWRGDFSLAISVWGMLFVVVFFFVLELVAYYFVSENISRKNIAMVFWSNVLASSLVLFVWYFKGSISSLCKTKEVEKSFKNISCLFLLLVTSAYLFFLSNTVMPGLKASIDGLKESASYAWDIEIINDGKDMVLTGAIGDGISDDVGRVLFNNPDIKVMHTNLEMGGYVEEAELIAKRVKDYKLDTYVSTICVSACTKIFLRGKNRYLRDGAKLGFHRTSFPGFDRHNFLADNSRNIYVEIGVSDAFIDKVLNTPSEDMWFPTNNELLEANVIDAVVSGSQFAMSEVKVNSVEGIENYFMEMPLYVALKNKEPEVYQNIVREAKAALENKKSFDYITEMGSFYLRPVRDKHLPYSDSEVLLKFNRLILKQMRSIAKVNKRLCYEYAFTGEADSMQAALNLIPEELIQQQTQLISEIILTSDFNRDMPEKNEADRIFEEVINKTVTDLGGDSDVLFQFGESEIDKEKACDALIVMYENVFELGKKKAEIYFRASFSS